MGEHQGRAAGARAAWPIRIYPLGAEPAGDLSATSLPEERLAMVEALSLDAFTLAGRPLPAYTRAESPVAVRRLGEEALGEDP